MVQTTDKPTQTADRLDLNTEKNKPKVENVALHLFTNHTTNNKVVQIRTYIFIYYIF
jgi:hypothetical protein